MGRHSLHTWANPFGPACAQLRGVVGEPLTRWPFGYMARRACGGIFRAARGGTSRGGGRRLRLRRYGVLLEVLLHGVQHLHLDFLVRGAELTRQV